jgi:predicted nucleic acid-binding protein
VGLSEVLTGKRVYFDANIFIYSFEGFAGYEKQLAALARLVDDKACTVCTSEFTLCEVLTKPFRENRSDVVINYRRALEIDGIVRLVPATRATFLRAAMFRGQLGLKTPDAIHAATAVESECAAFLTNDSLLRLPAGLEKVLFSDG